MSDLVKRLVSTTPRCSWCNSKYADGRPDNFGSDPKCAFGEDGVFKPDNWMCAGLDWLRDAGYEREVWCDDQHATIVPIQDTGDFIVLSYYKHRGRTEGAWRISTKRITVLTVHDVRDYMQGEK